MVLSCYCISIYMNTIKIDNMTNTYTYTWGIKYMRVYVL